MKKYELLKSDTILVGDRTLFRIRRISDGELGGYIEKEGNLSHNGDAWVYNNARVYDNAWVYNNARVYDNARIYGNAWVFGNSWISENALVYENARVYDNARIYGNAWVFGDARVYVNARVHDDARLSKPNELVVITNLQYPITATKYHIQIGCRQLTYHRWNKISEEEAIKMGLDPKNLIVFKTLIQALTINSSLNEKE